MHRQCSDSESPAATSKLNTVTNHDDEAAASDLGVGTESWRALVLIPFDASSVVFDSEVGEPELDGVGACELDDDD